MALLDPELTTGLPPRPTAATGLDALTHAVESYLSIRPNPVSDGLALQVTAMVGNYLPRAVADGADREARAQLLLAAHLAGTGMARTGLGLCHAIGHAIGGRFDVPHGEALSLVLPGVLRFNAAVRQDRIADLAFPLGAGRTGRSAAWNAAAAIDAVAALIATLGLGVLPGRYRADRGRLPAAGCGCPGRRSAGEYAAPAVRRRYHVTAGRRLPAEGMRIRP